MNVNNHATALQSEAEPLLRTIRRALQPTTYTALQQSPLSPSPTLALTPVLPKFQKTLKITAVRLSVLNEYNDISGIIA
jgi:hypothetical protein